MGQHRVRFMPNMYHRSAPDSAGAKKDPEHSSTVGGPTVEGAAVPSASVARHAHAKAKYTVLSADAIRDAVAKAQGSVKQFRKRMQRAHREATSPKTVQASLAVEEPARPQQDIETDVLEVWFAGVHCDVGGGAAPDTEPSVLSRDTLRWMVRELAQSRVPVLWVHGALGQLGLDLADPADGCGVLGNGQDALAPTHDELGVKGHWAWWILECIPLTVAYQDKQGRWVRKLRYALLSLASSNCTADYLAQRQLRSWQTDMSGSSAVPREREGEDGRQDAEVHTPGGVD
jgi:hypothetical protein